MKRPLLVLALALALALPASAEARVIELGGSLDGARVSCPDSCQAIGRVTGYQGRSGAARSPFVVPADGKIVAFTIALGKPDARQVAFFNNLYGGTPQVRLAILRKGKRRRTRRDHRLLAQSPLFRVNRYFGSTPSFALDRPLRVRRGHIVALTVPTWTPAFSVGLDRTNWWRSSRRKRTCSNVSQRAAQQALGRVVVYGCTYFTARLLYAATYVPDPKPTDRSASRAR
jgi:hypothetical protein